MTIGSISFSGIIVRFVVALALVILSWNPSEYSYYHWATANLPDNAPFILFSGLIMLIAWIVFLRATTRSLGPVGTLLAIAVAGSVLWLIIDFGWIDPANGTVLAWVVLVLLAAILTAGMSWSHLRRRMAGQADVDDVEA
jgi:hypothetical protein